jgi:hypothetical protein
MGARWGDQGGEQAKVGELRLGEGWRFSTAAGLLRPEITMAAGIPKLR